MMNAFKGPKLLKKDSFPSKVIKDEKSYRKTYRIENKETLKIDRGMLVTKIQHDIKKS